MTIYSHVAGVNLLSDVRLDCLTRCQFPLQRFNLRKSGTFLHTDPQSAAFKVHASGFVSVLSFDMCNLIYVHDV